MKKIMFFLFVFGLASVAFAGVSDSYEALLQVAKVSLTVESLEQ